MGTTTIYQKHNDFGRSLRLMSKKEIEIVSELSPYGKNTSYLGWSVPVELHNKNVYLLVFWKGRMMRLEQARERLINKYYDKYRGKTINMYEWTVLKKFILTQVEYQDSLFKKALQKQKRSSQNQGERNG